MAVVDTTAGFRFMYRLCGAQPTIQKLTFKDTETLYKGDLVNLESGQIDLAATNDTALVGVVLKTTAGTTAVTQVECIVDSDAVYAVYDANARAVGATLDIAGAAGAMTVAASSNVDVQVVADSAADEYTLVMIAHGEHFTN